MKLITEEWLVKAREDLDVALEIISKKSASDKHGGLSFTASSGEDSEGDY